MNILQINNAQCAPASANDNTGINRVVTALCEYYVNTYHDTCFNAYYNPNPRGQSEVFCGGLHLQIPLDKDAFKQFLIDKKIDVIVINVSVISFVEQIAALSSVAHECNIKTIYCIHFMPGYEALSYADYRLAYFTITHGGKIADILKKWVLIMSRPLSTTVIRRVIRSRYARPLASCDKVVVLAEPYIQRYLDIAKSVEYEKFIAIPNPLPSCTFIDENAIVAKEKEVLVVGRLYEPTKRISYVLQVWKMIEENDALSEWHLTIIGEGDSGAYYKWLVKQYGLKRVIFAGRQDPQAYYQRASILLSTSAHEGWPMVLMECMPMGVVPCVFGAYSSSQEIIDNGVNGFVVKDNDINAFNTTLQNLMLNDKQRVKIASAAIGKSKLFDMSQIGSRWHQLLFSLCATK